MRVVIKEFEVQESYDLICILEDHSNSYMEKG